MELSRGYRSVCADRGGEPAVFQKEEVAVNFLLTGMIFTDLPFNIKKTIDIIYCAQYNYAKDKQRGDR